MSIKIIADRLKEYAPVSQRDELNTLKEITQEIALSGLARANFFSQASFQGGSCLRIIHHLNRFSEDLDFILFKPDKKFIWKPFLKALQLEFKLYDFDLKVIDRSEADKAVKMAFLKESSFGKLFIFTHRRNLSDKQTIKIKLEIDTNPPGGSKFERQFINFPYTFSITTQDLPSLFAGKCHALLCRPYTKGRDWFDFVWYISKKVVPNYTHLTNAIQQEGPWKKKNVIVTKEWLMQALNEKIIKIDWNRAKRDIENFLRAPDRTTLKVWETDFFLASVKKLAETV